MINLALRYAFADNIISITNSSKYKLTDKGHEFVDRILQDKQLILTAEQELLIRIGQRISEVRLRKELL
jgi:DNA-binding PadR family transcriptional regulator